MNRKAQAYQQALDKLEQLPIYPGLEDFIQQLRLHEVKLAIVSDALRAEVELVLNRTGLLEHFSVIIAADDTTTSKPEPDGYLLAIERLSLKASNCLAIEDTPTGIQAARSAGVQVVGVAHTYPFHMLQRWTNWAVDYFTDLEVERVQQVFSRTTPQATAG